MSDDTTTATTTAPEHDPAVPQAAPHVVPARRRNPWRAFVLGVVALSVAVVGGAGLVRHPAAGSPTDLLRLPHTLLDRSYTLAEDTSAQRDHALVSRSGPGYEGIHIRSGFYDSDGDSHDDDLEIIAWQGKVDDPATARTQFAADVIDDSDNVFLRAPRRILPPGTTEPLVCAVIAVTGRPDHQALQPVPVCVWADHATVGFVYDLYRTDVPLASVDLDAYAADVSRIRSEVRVRAS